MAVVVVVGEQMELPSHGLMLQRLLLQLLVAFDAPGMIDPDRPQ